MASRPRLPLPSGWHWHPTQPRGSGSRPRARVGENRDAERRRRRGIIQRRAAERRRMARQSGLRRKDCAARRSAAGLRQPAAHCEGRCAALGFFDPGRPAAAIKVWHASANNSAPMYGCAAKAVSLNHGCAGLAASALRTNGFTCVQHTPFAVCSRSSSPSDQHAILGLTSRCNDVLH